MNPSFVKEVIKKDSLSLYLIDLPIEMNGFRHFLTSWLIRDSDRSLDILVDVGPAATVDYIYDALESLGVNKIDLILLTHIHIDHAGGCGHVLGRFPDANVIVSERGWKHLVDPSRLWESTVTTLGDTALKYKEMIPSQGEKINSFPGISELPLEIIATPGHASHHHSYLYDGVLFLGEAGGAYVPYPDMIAMESVWESEPEQGFPYIRPATPPPFQLETTVSSINKLLDLAPSADLLCYGHYGFSWQPERMLSLAIDQIHLWHEIIRNYMETVSHINEDNLLENIFERLVSQDPLLKNFPLLCESVRSREKFFMQNSIKGFIREMTLVSKETR